MATETIRFVTLRFIAIISITFCLSPLKKRLVKTHTEKDLDKWRDDMAIPSLKSERTSDGRL